jgi:Icc-related predicted phosphoesterase
MHLRVLTVADLHQSRTHFQWLCDEVRTKRPDLVAFVGDVLSDPAVNHGDRVPTGEAAHILSSLRCPQLVFVRGNHEQEDWPKFVEAWPLDERPLVALDGTAHVFGPLVLVGFPCHTGWEDPWCETLPRAGNEITRNVTLSGRKVLPADHEFWLPPLIRRFGSAGRTLWLMHEPPQVRQIAGAYACNPEWSKAVERFRPLLTISGHDHETPKRYNTWHGQLDHTVCVNVGRGVMSLHYCVLDFEFPESKPCLPTRITVEAFPWKTQVVIQPR